MLPNKLMRMRSSLLVAILASILASMLASMLGLLAAAQTPKPTAPALPGEEYSGMYSFLREGEFVQITVEAAGKVSGFVSRYGDLESDRGAFLDHFFKTGKLDGNQLTFTTDVVHGVWFDFKGVVTRGEGKTLADEGYYVVQGTLTENKKDDANKTSAKSKEVTLKLFPQDATPKVEKRQ